jgi:hypothetical protein
MKPGRKLFYIVLAAFSGLCLLWVFHFPYCPARLYAAVPPGATFISLHEDFDEHWQDFAQNPITTNLLYAAGIDGDIQAKALKHPELHRALKRLAGREFVVAHTSRLGRSGEPAWIAASWLGGFSNLLRIGLALRPPDGVQRFRMDGQINVWVLDRQIEGASQRLSFSIVEGVLLACYSKDPTAVRALIARVNATAPPSPELVKHLSAERGRSRPPHRLWCHWYRRVGKAHELLRPACELAHHSRNASRGRLIVDLPLPASGAEHLASSPAADVFGAEPCAVAALPLSHLAPCLGALSTNQLVCAISEVMRSCGQPEPLLVAAMYGGELSGRLMDIRIPAIVIGTRARASVNTPAVMAEAIDRLNAERRWALLVRRQAHEGVSLMVIDGTRGDMFSLINNEEKPAFAMKNGWLLFGSNLQTLSAVCREGGGTTQPQAPWVEALAPHDAPMVLWADLQGSAETIKHGVAVYRLIQRVSEAPANHRGDRAVNALESWTQAVRPLGWIAAWGSGTTDGVALQFRMGEDEE